ncbi:tetraacyldisaccharide 4'-kinase [Mesonia aestuariivivens]|uniref:Tetraacyldisaccharide 4'-kinase n=1 Tax=Mesonia aestuariivivens TaxID=2796128 RepID=A0ABS6W543_9FLAO|nr:tetraacyldisaccharide 4'-kinase [Mesonia aestuariivivens]MBW2962986.1 tetraacyldisaccharide 4'-kinase [Mesonia aestuariivivens]
MKVLRKLLFPFSILYGIIVLLRNKLYDWGVKKSVSFSVPVICVGNLSVGGTGKSPMIEYLIRLIKDEHQLATLSRGYKRESKGFYVLTGNEKGSYVGDEPLQFKRKFPEVKVAVDEQRVRGIQHLLELPQKPEIVLLDDAFQHRKVTPKHSILLTTYDQLYVNDLMLPAGNLREPKSGAKRADIIVVTKCPSNIEEQQMLKMKKKLRALPHQQIYFSKIKYSDTVLNIDNDSIKSRELPYFTLVTGIANPQQLKNHLESLNLKFQHLNFSDHYNFKEKDILKIKESSLVITTEKDFMRLKSQLENKKLYYLPIEVEFINNASNFDSSIKRWVNV